MDSTLVKIRKVDSEINADYMLKCIIIGDSGVGKSCLLNAYVNNKFELNAAPTIGIELAILKFAATNNENVSVVFKIQVWDCAGQKRFNSIVKSYFRNASIILLVYDVTNQDTFRNLQEWHSQITNNIYYEL